MVTGMTSCKRGWPSANNRGVRQRPSYQHPRVCRPSTNDAFFSSARRIRRSDVLRANYIDLSWRAADYVDKILRGMKPADLAVQQPTKVRAGDQSQNC